MEFFFSDHHNNLLGKPSSVSLLYEEVLLSLDERMICYFDSPPDQYFPLIPLLMHSNSLPHTKHFESSPIAQVEKTIFRFTCRACAKLFGREMRGLVTLKFISQVGITVGMVNPLEKDTVG